MIYATIWALVGILDWYSHFRGENPFQQLRDECTKEGHDTDGISDNEIMYVTFVWGVLFGVIHILLRIFRKVRGIIK